MSRHFTVHTAHSKLTQTRTRSPRKPFIRIDPRVIGSSSAQGTLGVFVKLCDHHDTAPPTKMVGSGDRKRPSVNLNRQGMLPVLGCVQSNSAFAWGRFW